MSSALVALPARRPFYFNKAGLPIVGDDAVLVWDERFEDLSHRFILRTWIRNRNRPNEEINVVTIWDGMDVEMDFPHRPPLIFGTLATGYLISAESRAKRRLGEERRYSSLEDAWRGHWDVVEGFERSIVNYETQQDWRWKAGTDFSRSPF